MVPVRENLVKDPGKENLGLDEEEIKKYTMADERAEGEKTNIIQN